MLDFSPKISIKKYELATSSDPIMEMKVPAGSETRNINLTHTRNSTSALDAFIVLTYWKLDLLPSSHLLRELY